MKNVIFEEGIPTKNVLVVYQKAFYNAGFLMVNNLIHGGPSLNIWLISVIITWLIKKFLILILIFEFLILVY